MSLLSPEEWIIEFLQRAARQQLQDALSKLRDSQPGQRRSALLHKNERGLSCLERLVELRKSDKLFQPLVEACIEENIDLSGIVSSRESLGAILRFACTSNVDKTCLKTLFDFSERFVDNNEDALRQLFLQEPPVSSVSGEKDGLLVCALRHLFNPKSFQLFWQYFHNRLHCFDERPDLIHEAKKENMPYNLLELLIASPKPPPTVNISGVTLRKDRQFCHSLESWNLVIDLLASKQVLKEMLLNTSYQSLSDDATFPNVANVFQDAISCQSTPATTVRALDAAFTKCGLISVDSSLLVSSSENIFSKSFKPNCLHLALRRQLNGDAFDALVAIIDEHNLMNQLLSESVHVDWSKLSLPPISSMKWKSSSSSASQINILHFAILMQCSRDVLFALVQRLVLQDLFWDMYETRCDFFQRREPCSLANTAIVASDSSDDRSVDDYDSISTMMLAALTASSEDSCYKCLCEVMDGKNDVCSVCPRKQRLCLAEGTVAPFNRPPHFLRMNEPVKDSMSPLQKRAFTIPNLQRIAKFAARSVKRCFSLAYVNTSFQETMIDFHTSHILFRQVMLSLDDFIVEHLTYGLENCRVPWVLQEILLIPKECNVAYEKFTSSLRLSKTLLEHAMSALESSSMEDRFHVLNFLLSHTRCLQRNLSSGELLGYIADFCHRKSERSNRELNFIVEIFIRAHIESGAWNYDVLFTKIKKDDRTGQDEDDEDDEEDDENSTSFDNGIRLFFKILCNQRISADLLKYFLDFFPESSARCISNLFDSYSYHPPYDDIEDIDGTRTGSCKYPSAFCPLAAFTTAVVVSSVSLKKLEKIIGFLVSRDRLSSVALYRRSRKQKFTNLWIMIERSSSVEKLEVVLDALAAHGSSKVLVDELMGSRTDGDSLVFIAFNRERPEDREKVFRKLLSFIESDPRLVRDLLIERSFMLCEKTIDHGCPEFLRFILDLYREHRLLEPALASRLGRKKNPAIFLALGSGYSKNIEVLRLLLKAYAECGLLQHALSSPSKVPLLSFEQTPLQFSLGRECLFTKSSPHKRDIAKAQAALDVVRILIAHFESAEKFQHYHSKEINNGGTYITHFGRRGLHITEVQELLTNENCWSESRKWFNEKFGELPPVDKESGRRREREE